MERTDKEDHGSFTAFAGVRLVSTGPIETVLLKAKEVLDRGEMESVLIFEDRTGEQVDFDFRGEPKDVLARLTAHPWFNSKRPPAATQTGPGRPKLGVVCREVSLLPRHWEWLERQPSGISAALRRLVDEARLQNTGKERARAARDAAGKFIWAIGGNLPGFEEASRALYAKDLARLEILTSSWPVDIRSHFMKLARHANDLETASQPEK